ncbi:MAG: hypothetical protein KBC84_01000 [Proteobacteria bacterium]|nr:hypothetical protein [Pseudomonadota bacterium]
MNTNNGFSFDKYEIVGEVTDQGDFELLDCDIIESRTVAKENGIFQAFDANPNLRADIIEQNIVNTAAEATATQAKHQVELEQVRQAGYEEGYNKAKEELEQMLNERIIAFENLQKENLKSWQDINLSYEKKCIDLSLEVAKKIFLDTVELKPDYIHAVITESLKNLAGSRPLRIRVSPQDYEFLEVIGIPPEMTMEEGKLKYIADEAIHSGCIIETDFGDVNVVLDEVWHRIKDSITTANR